jgi:hypothetical protein
MAFFDIILQTSGSLHPDNDPTDFISTYTGIIRCTREKDGKVVKVGKVKAYRIHADLARENRSSVLEACDAHSHQMLEVYESVFDAETDDLRDEVREQFDGFASDVLVLDYVVLSPRWRGLKLGLLAARKMIDLLGNGCAMVVAWVYPLNPEYDDFIGLPEGWVPRHRSRLARHAARQTLRRYFRRMGFERVPGTKFHGLSLARVTPTLADLLRPST